MRNNKHITSVVIICLSFNVGFIYGLYKTKKRRYDNKILRLKTLEYEQNEYLNKLEKKYNELKHLYSDLKYKYDDINEKYFQCSFQYENELNKYKQEIENLKNNNIKHT